MKFTRVWFYFILPILLTSCQQDYISRIFVETQDCKSPCWSSIRPSYSTVDDVYREFGNNSEIREFDQAVTLRDGFSIINAKTTRPVEDIFVDLKDDTVYSIYFDIEATRLEDVLPKLGMPDEVGIGRVDYGDYFQYHKFLLYNEQGIILCVVLKGTDKEINERSQVTGVIYTEKLNFEDVLDIYNNEEPVSIVPWVGFGFYKIEKHE